MRKELYDICRGILENESESKTFTEKQTAGELYEYLKEKVPNLSEEEFEDFMVDAMDQYAESCENAENSRGPIGDDALENVAGGVGLGQKIASAGLALMAFLPAAGATNFNKDARMVGDSSGASLSQRIGSAVSSKFQKVKDWAKNHKRLVIGTAVAAGALVAGGVVYKVYKDNQRKTQENEKVGEAGKKTAKDYRSMSSAASDGNVEAVKEFLNDKTKATTKEKKYALSSAVAHNKADVAKLLLENDETLINARDERGSSTLNIIALRAANAKDGGWNDVVDLLLRKGADANAKDEFGKTALERAAYNPELYKVFLKHGYGSVKEYNMYRKVEVNDSAIFGGGMDVFRERVKTDKELNKTAVLEAAVRWNRTESVEVLFEECSEEIKLRNDLGAKILDMAVFRENQEIVDLLLKHGVKIDFNSHGFYTTLKTCRNENIRRAVLKVADNRLLNGKERLKVNYYGANLPVLIWACYVGEELRNDIVSLLKNGEKLNVNIKDDEGRSLLDWAAEYGNKELVEELYTHGAKINGKNNATLRYAGRNKSGIKEEIIRFLLSKHKNPGGLMKEVLKESDTEMVNILANNYFNSKESEQYWEWALQNSDRRIYRLFPQYKNKEDLTNAGILMARRLMAGKTDFERVKSVVEDLVSAGADINARDDEGKTALAHALDIKEKPEIVKFLLSQGADVNARYSKDDSRTILAYATEENSEYLSLLKDSAESHR